MLYLIFSYKKHIDIVIGSISIGIITGVRMNIP